MTFRTGLGLLIVTLGVGASGIAAAQTAPAPAPGQPPASPAGQPAAAPPAAGQPAAGQTAPAQAPPPAGFGETASVVPDDDKPDELPARVPWRGTNVSWTNTATTSLLGVGQELQSDAHEQYLMNWGFKLNYYVVDQDKWSVQVSTVPGFSVELTNSNITTTEQEVQFNDLPLLATYGRSLWSHDLGFSTSMSLGSGFIFPTSPASQGNGTALVTSQRVGLSQGIPLAGPDAPVFKTFNLSASLRWDHRFTEATTGVSGDLERERQNAGGETIIDDQLSGAAMVHDTLQESITLSFNETIPPGMPIGLSGTIYFAHSFKYQPTDTSGCDVIVMGECVDAGGVTEPNTAFNTIGFNLGLNFQPVPEASVAFSYDSGTPQLGPDGQRRSLFFNPYATFSGTLTIHPDAIYERITGPSRKIARDSDSKRRSF